MVLYPHSITTMTTCSVCNFMIQSRLLKILGMHLVCVFLNFLQYFSKCVIYSRLLNKRRETLINTNMFSNVYILN